MPHSAAPRPVADLAEETDLIRSGHARVAGMDEVGRGALAGPVVVGVGLVDAQTVPRIADLTDSKLVAPSRRIAMVEEIAAWIPTALGAAQAWEIDELGMTAALRLAGQRALTDLAERGLRPDAVLLDGKHDWLSAPEPDLFSPDPGHALEPRLAATPWEGPVRTRIKADVHCASVAAASITAKVWRDDLMERLDGTHPGYGWAGNKGYGAAAHRERLAAHGATAQHRLSWNLGITEAQADAARAARHRMDLSDPGLRP